MVGAVWCDFIHDGWHVFYMTIHCGSNFLCLLLCVFFTVKVLQKKLDINPVRVHVFPYVCICVETEHNT